MIQNKYPWFDKKNNKWVDRDEFNKNKREQVAEEDKKVDEADKKLKEPEKYTEDLSLANDIEVNDEDDGDELPF